MKSLWNSQGMAHCMSKKIACISTLLIGLLFLPLSPRADENPSFEFLRTEIGARPAAMGGAFVGMIGDIHSLFYNPGALPFIRRSNASLTYLNSVMDFNVGAGAYIRPLSELSALGVGIHYFDYGEFQGKDKFGQDTGTFGANDVAISAGYGKMARTDLGIGANIKYIRSKIAGYSASAIAADLGILYYLRDKNVTVGISVMNLGRAISAYLDTKEDLPAHLKFGLAKSMEHLPLVLSGELRYFNGEDLYYNGGGELIFGNNIRLRFGYSSVGRDQKLGIDGDRWSGFSLGAGIMIRTMMIDYALTSMGGIGAQNRFTVSAFF